MPATNENLELIKTLLRATDSIQLIIYDPQKWQFIDSVTGNQLKERVKDSHEYSQALNTLRVPDSFLPRK